MECLCDQGAVDAAVRAAMQAYQWQVVKSQLIMLAVLAPLAISYIIWAGRRD